MPGSRGGEGGGSDARIPRGRGRGFRCPDPEGEREGVQMTGFRGGGGGGSDARIPRGEGGGSAAWIPRG